MTIAEQIKAAKEQLKSLQAQETKGKFGNLTVKIGDKGSINVYGLNKKFPVCLYLSQLMRYEQLISSPEFKQFIVENMDKLAVKTEE
jgi:hypothetical protein